MRHRKGLARIGLCLCCRVFWSRYWSFTVSTYIERILALYPLKCAAEDAAKDANLFMKSRIVDRVP
jgi:hypothetical protein